MLEEDIETFSGLEIHLGNYIQGILYRLCQERRPLVITTMIGWKKEWKIWNDS